MNRIATAAALALTLVAAKSDPLAGRVAGQPVKCIAYDSFIQGPEIVDENTILYRAGGKTVWKTGPTGSCPSLHPISTLIVRVYGSQLCENDFFRVLQPGETIPGPICRFTKFTPYTRADSGKAKR